ncbi:MAG: S66 peptidase family protein [Candidatus Acidiferrales bacterium]
MPQPLKPLALRLGDSIRVVSLASPVEEERLQKGCEEVKRLGYEPKFTRGGVLAREGFFAGSAAARVAALKEAFSEPATRAVICTRGGYGSNYLLEGLSVALASPKLFVGYSDLTSLQVFLWQKFRWVTLYGPMIASGFDKGAGAVEGYDQQSFVHAVMNTKQGWVVNLCGEAISPGSVEGILLGGCLTLIETTLGTPWELDTHGAILILEDRGMRPWQVDRALMHMKQAGKFNSVEGIILGDFPECPAPAGSETVRDVARRILGPLEIPVVWGAPVGHTQRPMLTLPLGVRARLSTDGQGQIEILEAACSQ